MSTEKVNIFIAYSRKDTSYLEQLRTYLKPLNRDDGIQIWFDGEIIPGSVWEEQIKQNLHKADIILLLVSANSLASDYFYDKEMSDALERHHQGKTMVIPVILSDCNWEFTELKNLQALPEDGKPVKSWQDDSKAYANIVRRLNQSIGEIRKRKKVPSPSALSASLYKKDQQFREKATSGKENNQSPSFRKYGTRIGSLLLLAAAVFVLFKMISNKDLMTNDTGNKPVDTPPALSPVIESLQENMVALPGGTFAMGCTNDQEEHCFIKPYHNKDIERPVQQVSIAGYLINKYEVSQTEWAEVMGKEPPHWTGCGDCAVGFVTWYQAQEFITRLNALTERTYRLPSEAEWEYAARGGENLQYAGSQDEPAMVAWFGEGTECMPHPVGKKGPNGYGLYDMSGNVFEWCQDKWYFYASMPSHRDGKAIVSGDHPERITRSGSCKSNAQFCRVSLRHLALPDQEASDFGFRLAHD